jgi:hypothetical protein
MLHAREFCIRQHHAPIADAAVLPAVLRPIALLAVLRPIAVVLLCLVMLSILRLLSGLVRPIFLGSSDTQKLVSALAF